MKRVWVFLVTVCVLLLSLTACGGSKTVVDYGDAAAFEEALNRGENLEGKTVMFTAREFHPDSKLGYNIWAGEHLNFVSERNPDVKVGDTVAVKATKIANILGSWIIGYEKVSNAVVGETTITSSGNSSQKTASENAGTGKTDNSEAITETTKEQQTATKAEESELTIEYVDADLFEFNNYFGKPTVSAYVAFKNTSDMAIRVRDARFDYIDNDEKLLSTDQYVQCIPDVVKPGQTGYLYSYYHDISGVDTSNGFTFKPDGTMYEAKDIYEFDVTDVSFKTGRALDISIIGRATNNTNKDQSFVKPAAVYFDKNNKIVGFCYGMESFAAGQTKSFEISGDMISEEYDPDIVDHVEVYVQGGSLY